MPIKGVLLEAKMSAGIDITSRSLPNHVRVHFSRVLRREESLPRYCFGSSWLVLCTSWLVCPEVKPDSTSHRSWSDSPRFRCHLFGLTPSSLPSGSDTGADSISGVRLTFPFKAVFVGWLGLLVAWGTSIAYGVGFKRMLVASLVFSLLFFYGPNIA